MTEPTRQDALDAADVFFSALRGLMQSVEMERQDDPRVAAYEACFKASGMCVSLALEMGLDLERLHRVVTRLNERPPESHAPLEMLERMLRDLKDVQEREE